MIRAVKPLAVVLTSLWIAGLRFLAVTIVLAGFLREAGAQHDGARDAVQQIALERFGKIDQILENKKPFAGESEAAFVKMLQALAENDIDTAMSHARHAVDLGIPVERLLVGPRELLGQLHQHPAFTDWMQQTEQSSLVHGPMVGSMTDHSASVWLRTLNDAKVVLTCLETGQKVTAQTDQNRDWTAVLSFDGLKSDQQYQYTVEVDGKICAKSKFKTFCDQGKGGKFSVGFGGGAGFVPEWEKMWQTVLSRQPNAFLMMGDNVYIDQPEHSLTQRYCYYRRQSRPEWRELISQTPMYSIWDDHDFGTNDCVPGPEIDHPPWKRSVWEVFQQNWVNPSYGGGAENPGCWYEFHVGDVHFIMLDGRYYRDLKGGSMLGPVQKKWLLQTLQRSQATFKVIASPVPFTAGIKKGSRDPWDGFPEEREELFKWIETQRIEGVFLIAADRHRTDLRVTQRPDAYDLYEFESSRLTNHHVHGVVKSEGLIWGYNDTCSYALMSFETDLPDPQVTFECIDLEGETKYRHLLKRSQLEFKK